MPYEKPASPAENLITAVDSNNYPAFLSALKDPRAMAGLFQTNAKKQYPLQVAAQWHSSFMFDAILDAMTQLKDTLSIKINSALLLFAQDMASVSIDSPKIPVIIAATIQTLLQEIKKCKALSADDARITMVNSLLDSPLLTNGTLRTTLKNAIDRLVTQYGHSDPSVRELALAFRDAEEMITNPNQSMSNG